MSALTLSSRRTLLAIFFILISCITIASAQTPVTLPPRVTISGTVYDIETHEPVPFATVHLLNTGRTATANDRGQFRLVTAPGDSCQLKFSHVAYYSDQLTLIAPDTNVVQDISLRPTMVVLNTIRVTAGNNDPGEAIILEAIKRKQEILNRLHDYRFDAYTKLVVRDKKKPDSASIILITESQVSSFWERPDHYKETITLRRQTKNLPPDANLVAVGDILNFNKDRIDLGDEQVVSPTAHDALDHYRYYLLDTLFIDSARVFVLDVEPRSDVNPLFVGRIQIVDSTFDVVGVDFGFNAAFHPPMASNLRYAQRFALFHEKYWMPVEIHFSGEVDLPFPIPGVPREMTFAHVASLNSYRFEEGTPKGTFGEVAAEVAPQADRIDTTAWAVGQTIPLTDNEKQGYTRIDSIESRPKPLAKQLIRLLFAIPLIASTQDQFFHFNRVEGTYVGLGGTLRPNPRLSIGLRGGYAFETDRGQYEGSLSYLLWKPQAVQIQMTYHQRVVHRPALYYSGNESMTLPALIDGSDPFDYYNERGYHFQVSGKLVNHTRLVLGYHHYRQTSLERKTDYTLFDPTYPIRDNPPIADGSLRAVSAEFRYDTRPMFRLKGRDVYANAFVYTQFSVGVERSSPDLLDSDFSYTRFSARLYRRQNTLGLGQTSFLANAGVGTRFLPPQRYFGITFSPMSNYQRDGFQTLDGRNFGGSTALSMAMEHDFGTRLFRWSGLPLIKRLPFELSIHGGVFWTDFGLLWGDFNRHEYFPGDENVRTARTAYSEIGFGLARLAPFLGPFNLQFLATWQLSVYDTNRFAISWELGL